MKPRPELLPFFKRVNWCVGGSDGIRLRGYTLPPGAFIIATEPPRRQAGRSRRETYQTPRARKLAPAQCEAARAMAASGQSLRAVAARLGVSHETVRTVLQAREAICAA